MTRKQSKRDQQVYKLAQYGATVTIDYDTSNPPPFFQPGSGVVIVGEHHCAPTFATFSAPANTAAPGDTNGPTADTPEMIAWKASRSKTPVTTEQVEAESGLPKGMLSFENLSGIAASMGTE